MNIIIIIIIIVMIICILLSYDTLAYSYHVPRPEDRCQENRVCVYRYYGTARIIFHAPLSHDIRICFAYTFVAGYYYRSPDK